MSFLRRQASHRKHFTYYLAPLFFICIPICVSSIANSTWPAALTASILMVAEQLFVIAANTFAYEIMTVLPSLVLGMTAFTRIIIVLSILRQALGTQQTPPNQVLIAVALFLSFFIMGPVFEVVYRMRRTIS